MRQTIDGEPVDALGPSNRVSWGGTGRGRDSYLVTEDSAPAPLGASLGWILQLDGDAHRNAFLNSPWVKAVIPIRRNRESAAITWLKENVEGTEGLDQPAKDVVPVENPTDTMVGRRRRRDDDEQPEVPTVEEALLALAAELNKNEVAADRARAADRLFENGFDPLEGGTELRDFPVFDQWIEVLPTDQIVAEEYGSNT
jgi:hypothetical protein